MAKIKPTEVKILNTNERLVTLLLYKIDRKIQVSKLLFDFQKKIGLYQVIEEK